MHKAYLDHFIGHGPYGVKCSPLGNFWNEFPDEETSETWADIPMRTQDNHQNSLNLISNM